MDHSKEENQIMRLNVEIRIWSILSHLDGNRVHLFPFFDMTSLENAYPPPFLKERFSNLIAKIRKML